MPGRSGEASQVSLLDPVELAGRTAPSRVIFGPHETNLGQGRGLSARHVAYYERRAAGGAGVIITETASVHPATGRTSGRRWPRTAPPAGAQVAAACHPTARACWPGSATPACRARRAYSQRELWAPSGFADVVSRETPRRWARRRSTR